MKIIYTNKNEEIFVDDDDYTLLSRHTWSLTNHNYARTTINGNQILMHKLIMPSKGVNFVTDHINRNKLDNRKENLRIITKYENHYNISNKAGHTGFLGVQQLRNCLKFKVAISHENKTLYLGLYSKIEDCAKLRDYAVWLLRGELGVYNFPEIDYSKFEHPKKEHIYNKVKEFIERV